MHSVIENILARKNKRPPFDDGRKIALVCYGGIMAGIRGAGAMIALEEMGLDHAFDNVYGISAGFANASYLLSGQGKMGTSIYYEDCCSQEFINFYHPWHAVDNNFLIERMIHDKPINVDAIIHNPTRLHARLMNVGTHYAEYLEVHDVGKRQFFDLMRAAVSIPILGNGSVLIGDSRYRDVYADYHWADHLQHVLVGDATDILIQYNYNTQRHYNHENLDIIWDTDRVCELYPNPQWQLSRFEIRPEALKHACVQMGTHTKELFGENGEISLEYKLSEYEKA